MDDSEQRALTFLKSLGFTDIRYEPDGNVPPDFVVNGRIAVEVRRLNQHSNASGEPRGLETVAYPLVDRTKELLQTMGAPTNGTTWFVTLSFQRPLPNWKMVRTSMLAALRAFRDNVPDTKRVEIQLFENLDVTLLRASKVHDDMFLFGGWSDGDSGGWLLHEIGKNLQHCVTEKARKVQPYRERYPEWWLVLPDHIGYAMADDEREMFRDQIKLTHDFDRVVLIDPRNPSRHFVV